MNPVVTRSDPRAQNGEGRTAVDGWQRSSLVTRPSSSVVTRLPADPWLLHGVREMVGSVLELHGWPADRVDDARIVVSELVTNAVVHAGTELEVRVEVDTDARLSVTDYVPERQPNMRPHDPAQAGGLGLQLVDQLSERWGVAISDQAKTVWCELAPHPRTAIPRPVRQADHDRA